MDEELQVPEGHADDFDLFVIGGGINGCGIARDAAGRGLKVGLAEKGDLAQATSSASTKLFHGGLRYLEYYEFRLVREALIERETLLVAMPHISWPLRFVLPHHDGLRPRWLVRLGLFIYDHLGGRKILPPTRSLDLHPRSGGRAAEGAIHSGVRVFRLLGRGQPAGRAERTGRRGAGGGDPDAHAGRGGRASTRALGGDAQGSDGDTRGR